MKLPEPKTTIASVLVYSPEKKTKTEHTIEGYSGAEIEYKIKCLLDCTDYAIVSLTSLRGYLPDMFLYPERSDSNYTRFGFKYYKNVRPNIIDNLKNFEAYVKSCAA